MKKLSIMAIMAVAAITLASCNQTRPPKADVKTDIDSLSYTLGNQLGNQVKGSGMSSCVV